MFRTRWALLSLLMLFGIRSTILAAEESPSRNQAAPTERKPVDYGRDIRPLLSDKCFKCHGPDKDERKAGLRFDVIEKAFAPAESGETPIVPGKPETSALVQRIFADDEFTVMPPADSRKSLSPAEKELFRRWIAEGARHEQHWSFIPPTRPDVPAVKNDAWCTNEIDRFLLARLEAEGVSPSPEADRRTLIRRVTFDLTGLPPTPEEVEAFVNDTSPDAYETVVDRLLASAHYGEHRARYWLDAARYGDTHGLHLDNYREMWPYRDWVIDAFNTNMPFDRFTIEQLAGDLLPEATLEQQIASGFNRCHVTTNEGGSIAEEVYVRNVIDRVETTGTVFMGLTVGCAVCHDHKFDPVTMRDFYSMFAFFNSLDGNPMDGNKKAPPPFVEVPLDNGQQERIAELKTRIAQVDEQLAARAKAAEAAFTAWVREHDARASADSKSPSETPAGAIAHYPLDEAGGNEVTGSIGNEPTGTVQGKVARVDGKFAKALRFDGGFVAFGNASSDARRFAAFERDAKFSYGAWVNTPGNVTGAPLAKMEDGNAYRGYDLYLVGRKVAMHLIHQWPANAIKVTTKQDVLTPNQWHHVFVTYDGSSKAAGVTLYVDGKPQPVDVNADGLSATTVNATPLQLGRRNPGSPFTGGSIDDVRIYPRRLSAVEVGVLAGDDPIGTILATAPEKRTPQQIETLRAFYLNNHDKPYRTLAEQRSKLQTELAGITVPTATTLVFKERAQPKPAYMLKRGQYDQKGEQVERKTPAALPPMNPDLPKDRLGFAKWLVSPQQPLTARVTVNRFWQQVFGVGIVKTAEDFGSQGEWPSHPKLLDWLAVQFREDGWDVKRFFKRMVMSSAYRQSSKATPALLARDPENRLLARGPRYRLDAEMLRDQALAVSGLLYREVGGPSVKPPQPDGLWFAVGYSGSNTVRFRPDKGPEKVHRRSLYTFWKRTAPPPQMRTFDAPSRESCMVRRERTNTPLQALLLLNDPQYVEAARALAERVLHEGGDSVSSRIDRMFLLVTARHPDDDEQAVLAGVLNDHLAEFTQDVEAAKKLIAVGESSPDASLNPSELAAWTMLANLVLNLDEVLNKN